MAEVFFFAWCLWLSLFFRNSEAWVAATHGSYLDLPIAAAVLQEFQGSDDGLNQFSHPCHLLKGQAPPSRTPSRQIKKPLDYRDLRA